MSQHLITDFINRTYVFKPFKTNKLTTKQLVKADGSTRHNNDSPEDIEESIHNLKSIKVKHKKTQDVDQEKHIIDIII